ncbi:TPA: hypothetical protein HA246_03415 [Candidatus Woesearchaeota archaeon]|nr:hypothetical protein [Candidatus Woesearchaeota archaeon]
MGETQGDQGQKDSAQVRVGDDLSALSASQQTIIAEYIAVNEAYAAFKAGNVFFDASTEMPKAVKDLDALAQSAPQKVPETERQLHSKLYPGQAMRPFRVIDYKVQNPESANVPPLIYICHEHGKASQPNFMIDDVVIATLLDSLSKTDLPSILLMEGADIPHGKFKDFSKVEGMFIYKERHGSTIKIFRPVDGPGKDKPGYFEFLHELYSHLPPGQAPLFAFIDKMDVAEAYAAAYDRLVQDLPGITDNDEKLRRIADTFSYQLERLDAVKQNIIEPRILIGAQSFFPRAVVFGTKDVLWLAKKAYEEQQRIYEADKTAFKQQDYVVLAPVVKS